MRTARTTASAARVVPRERTRKYSAVFVSLLLLAACSRAQKDPRIAENLTPHIVVRVIERSTDATCERGEIIETLKCKLTPAPRIGCVYTELGDAIDNPVTRARREPYDCNSLDENEERVVVANQPSRNVKFFTDDRKERVLLKAGETEWLFLFFNGELLDSRSLHPGSAINYFDASGNVNWALVPSLLDVVPAHAERFSNTDLDALTLATPDGGAKLEGAIVTAFDARDLTPDDPDWTRLYERLPAARQKDISDEVISSIEAGEADAIGWAQIVPVPREPLIEALVTANSDDDDDSQEVPEAFNLLARLAPHRLAPLACHRLEKAWFSSETELSMNTVALALIAREKLRCPWVEPWLVRHACSWQLREENDELYLPTAPLASAKTRERIIAVELTLNDFTRDEESSDGGVEAEDEEEEDDEDGYASEPWGPLLLAAGYAQGPLPREFELKNARRFYKRVYVEKDDADDMCRAAADEVVDWVCDLPISMHELHRNACVITLDDEKHVMRLALERR
jgi:hypothetical protein